MQAAPCIFNYHQAFTDFVLQILVHARECSRTSTMSQPMCQVARKGSVNASIIVWKAGVEYA